MECPSCQSALPDDSKFCDACGAALSPCCLSCGARNRVGARFCADCGKALAEGSVTAAVRRPAIVETQPTPAERRHLTVMFCDLVGSVALSSRLDPEDLHELIGLYHHCVAKVMTRFEGFVAKYMGDGVLVYFGYPQAHEDSPERAAQAGLELVAAIGRLQGPERLQVRIGIATGLVVVGDVVGAGEGEEHSVVGETPNLAARLQTIAEPNTVVIGPWTRHLVGDLFEYRDLGTVKVKGFVEPVHAYCVLRPGVIASRFEALHGAVLTPLVGREEEIEQLLQRWERAKRGDGQIVLLSGEPGIGKSRLTATVQERIGREPHTRLRYFCSRHRQDSALHPIIAQLQRTARFERDDAPEARLSKLEALLAQTSPPGEDVALLAELLSIPIAADHYPALKLTPQRKKEKTFEALLGRLEGLARHRPMLIVYEDIHWIDPSTRELLDTTVERVRRLPVLLLMTFRPEFHPPWTHQPHVTVLALSRLDQRAGAALVERIIGNTASLQREVIEEIVERTDGVPLFLEELTKAVLETGGGNAKITLSSTSPAPLAVPATLHASLIARLDRLGYASKEIAQVGATIGREFSYELMACVADRGKGELRAALDRLADAGLLFRRGEPPRTSYVFKHALVQDAAYGSLLRGRRRELHARIARRLEEEPSMAAEAQPEILAYHCANAGLIGKAVCYWQKAGELSKARSAMTEAITQLQKALDLLPNLPDARDRHRTELEVQLALGGALLAAKGHAAEQTGKAYARARRLCELLDDTPNLLKALWGEFVHHHVRAETNRSHRAAGDLLALAERQNDPAGLVAGHRAIGDSFLHLGQLRAARTQFEQGLALYDPVQHRSLTLLFAENARVATLGFLSLTLGLLGFADQARARNGEALAEARELSHPISLAFALSVGCRLHFVLEDPPTVCRLAEELIALTEEQQFAFFLAMGTNYRGWALAEAGDIGAGMALLRKGIAGFRASGAAWILPFYLAQLATAHAKAGRVEDGLGQLSEALILTEKSGVRWFEAELHRRRGELLPADALGTEAEMEACFHRAMAIARQQDAKLWELRAATSLTRLWRDQGKRTEARDLLAPIYGWFSEGFDTPALKRAKALLEELA